MLPAGCKEVQDAFTDFWVDFSAYFTTPSRLSSRRPRPHTHINICTQVDLLYDPAAIGFQEEASLNCGAANLRFDISRFEQIHCYVPNGDDFYPDGWLYPGQVWAAYWGNYTGPLPEGFDMEKWASSLTWAGPKKSQGADQVMDMARDYNFNREGRMHSDASEVDGASHSWSALVPAAWFLQKNEDVHNAMMEKGANFHITGGNVGILHDQMTALPELYRTFGAQTQFGPVRKIVVLITRTHI